jgi:hypothetical protein
VMPWFAQVAVISFSARAADSRVATIQPTNNDLRRTNPASRPM